MILLPACFAMFPPPSAGGGGSISYVGGLSGGITSSAFNAGISLTSLAGGLGSAPAAGDLVVVSTALSATSGVSEAQEPTGYTKLYSAQSTDTNNCRLSVYYKFMPSTPETSFLLGSSSGNQQAYAVQVFRGVSQAASITSTGASATGTGDGAANPPSVTPSAAGSWVVVGGAAARISATAFTAPTGFASGFQSHLQSAGSPGVRVGLGHKSDWTSGAVNADAFGPADAGGGCAWGAYAFVLAPA